MIRQLDTVVLTRDAPEHGLRAGDVGAVVHAPDSGAGYEVEFVSADGTTVAVLTLGASDVRLMDAREILHARTLTRV